MPDCTPGDLTLPYYVQLLKLNLASFQGVRSFVVNDATASVLLISPSRLAKPIHRRHRIYEREYQSARKIIALTAGESLESCLHLPLPPMQEKEEDE